MAFSNVQTHSHHPDDAQMASGLLTALSWKSRFHQSLQSQCHLYTHPQTQPNTASLQREPCLWTQASLCFAGHPICMQFTAPDATLCPSRWPRLSSCAFPSGLWWCHTWAEATSKDLMAEPRGLGFSLESGCKRKGPEYFELKGSENELFSLPGKCSICLKTELPKRNPKNFTVINHLPGGNLRTWTHHWMLKGRTTPKQTLILHHHISHLVF